MVSICIIARKDKYAVDSYQSQKFNSGLMNEGHSQKKNNNLFTQVNQIQVHFKIESKYLFE